MSHSLFILFGYLLVFHTILSKHMKGTRYTDYIGTDDKKWKFFKVMSSILSYVFDQSHLLRTVFMKKLQLKLKIFNTIYRRLQDSFKRTYNSTTEEEKSKKIFLQRLKEVEKHNKLYKEGKFPYPVHITQYSDIVSHIRVH